MAAGVTDRWTSCARKWTGRTGRSLRAAYLAMIAKSYEALDRSYKLLAGTAKAVRDVNSDRDRSDSARSSQKVMLLRTT